KNLDSTQVDSIRFFPVYKKRAKTWNQSNYDRNIIEQHSAPRSGKLAESVMRGRKTQFFVRKTEPLANAQPCITRYRELTLRNAGMTVPPQPDPESTGQTPGNKPDPDELARAEMRDTLPAVQPGWLFQVPEYLNAPAPGIPPSK